MGSRIFNSLIVLFWLSTSIWLVATKLLPELGRGEPPNYRAVERHRGFSEPAVCWDIFLRDELVGKAASKSFPTADGDVEMRSRLELHNMSLSRFGHSLFQMALAKHFGSDTPIDLQIESRVWLDPTDRIRGLEARAYAGDLSAPIAAVDGQVLDDVLQLSYRLSSAISPSVPVIPTAGQLSFPLSERSSIDDETSPRGYMPPLRLHQTWKVRQYTPIRPPTSLLGRSEVMVAMVERQEALTWNGRLQDCWLVVYRNDSGSGSQSADKPLGRMWVRQSDGLVLKQEVALLDTPLRFVRLNEDDAAKIAGMLEQNWTGRAADRVSPRNKTPASSPAKVKPSP